jgi:ParB-like chromosome segregation protein Spo0J
MNIEKAIRIRCGGELHLELSQLNFFQKKLKTIQAKEFKKLKESLIKHGLPMGFHVWWNPKKEQWDIMDGHHRYLALQELEKDGWFVPPIPCNKVIAENRK